MTEWIDATKDPQAFADAVRHNKKVFAKIDDDNELGWSKEATLHLCWEDKHGDPVSSIFPGLFTPRDEDMVEVFAFYNKVKEYLDD